MTTLATIYYTATVFTPDDSDTNVYGEPTEPGHGESMDEGWYDAAWDSFGVFPSRDQVRPDTIEADDDRFMDGFDLDDIVTMVVGDAIGAIDSFDGETAYASDPLQNYTTGVRVMLAAHIEFHNICPVYGAQILPDEDDNCSLCGAPNQHRELDK